MDEFSRIEFKMSLKSLLTPRQNAIVEMHFYNGLTYVEVCEELGISRSTYYKEMEEVKKEATQLFII